MIDYHRVLLSYVQPKLDLCKYTENTHESKVWNGQKRAFNGAMTTVIAFPFTGCPSHSTKSNRSLNKWKTSDFPNPVGIR